MITTDRLHLRPAQPDDLTALHAIYSDARAMRYWDCLPYTEIAQTRHLLDGLIAQGAESDDLIVTLKGAVIGKAGRWRGREMGVIFAPDHWRKGLAREALDALIPWIFARRPYLDSLLADVDPRNAASLKLFASLGFVETGRAEKTYLIGERWSDSIYLTRPRSAATQT